jgi:hypothetical protein
MAVFLQRTGVDELICVGSIYAHGKRLRSFELAAQARDKLG